MHHKTGFPRRVAAIVVGLLFIPAGFADALHKYPNRDAYWHHGSGWVYSRQAGGLELKGSPYQIDGNDDVGAEYAMELKGARRTALVDVYYPDSAASGAKLASAKAAMQAASRPDKCATSQSEAKFAIKGHPDIVGVKTTYSSEAGADCSQLGLYFFQTSAWVVTIRTTAQATDTEAAAALDAFVRALNWNTLGTDPLLHDSGP